MQTDVYIVTGRTNILKSSVSVQYQTETPFHFSIKVEGRFIAKVFAKNTETAIEQANTKYQHADFGELADIDSEAIIVEDEKGNFVWSK